MEDKDKKALGIGLGALAAGLGIYMVAKGSEPPPPTCIVGETKCIGNNLYICNEGGQWQLSEENHPFCIIPDGTLEVASLRVSPAYSGETITIWATICNHNYPYSTFNVLIDGIVAFESPIPTFDPLYGWCETYHWDLFLEAGTHNVCIEGVCLDFDVFDDQTPVNEAQFIPESPTILYTVRDLWDFGYDTYVDPKETDFVCDLSSVAIDMRDSMRIDSLVMNGNVNIPDLPDFNIQPYVRLYEESIYDAGEHTFTGLVFDPQTGVLGKQTITVHGVEEYWATIFKEFVDATGGTFWQHFAQNSGNPDIPVGACSITQSSYPRIYTSGNFQIEVAGYVSGYRIGNISLPIGSYIVEVRCKYSWGNSQGGRTRNSAYVWRVGRIVVT